MSKKSRIVWFDCDGVLTTCKSSWTYLHEYFGGKDNPFFAQLYKRGYISYLDWMKIDIALMINSYGKPITRQDVVRALSKIATRKEAVEITGMLKRKGFIVGVISSGVDLLIKRVCKEINSDICLYNELTFVDDVLIPGGKPIVPLKEKPRIIEEYSLKYGVDMARVAYIGDSEWDIDVFKQVGLAIAIEPCGEACKYADYTVKSLWEIKDILLTHFL